MERQSRSLAEYFDGWYADMATSPVKDEIAQRHLGLPPQLLSTSLLGWAGVAEATAALCTEAAALDPGEDASLRSFHDEAVHVLERFDALRRVFATATAPSASSTLGVPSGADTIGG